MSKKKKAKKKKAKKKKAKKKVQAVMPGTSGAVGVKQVNGERFVHEMRRCGRNCSKCPHGPYWYLLLDGGRRAYVGKELTRETIDRAKKRN